MVAHIKGSIFSAKSFSPPAWWRTSKEASSQRRASAHLRGGAHQRKHLLSEELQPTCVVARIKGSILSAKSFSPPAWWRTSKEASSQRRASAHLRGGAHQRKHLLSEELQPTCVVAHMKEASSQRRASAHLRGGAHQRKHLLSEELQPTCVVAHIEGSIFSAKSFSPPAWWRTSKEASSQRRASSHLRGGAHQRKHLLSKELQPTCVVAHIKGSIFSAKSFSPPAWWRTSKEASSQQRASAHLRGGAHQRKHLLSEELQPTSVVAHIEGSISQRRASAHLRGGAHHRKHLLSEELQPTYVVAHIEGSIFSAKSFSPPAWWRTLREASSQRRASAHLRGGAHRRKHLLSEELQPTCVVAHIKGSIFSAKSFSPPAWWRTSKEASSQRRASAHLRGGAH